MSSDFITPLDLNVKWGLTDEEFWQYMLDSQKRYVGRETIERMQKTELKIKEWKDKNFPTVGKFTRNPIAPMIQFKKDKR